VISLSWGASSSRYLSPYSSHIVLYRAEVSSPKVLRNLSSQPSASSDFLDLYLLVRMTRLQLRARQIDEPFKSTDHVVAVGD
jgi:hypothetical protein